MQNYCITLFAILLPPLHGIPRVWIRKGQCDSVWSFQQQHNLGRRHTLLNGLQDSLWEIKIRTISKVRGTNMGDNNRGTVSPQWNWTVQFSVLLLNHQSFADKSHPLIHCSLSCLCGESQSSLLFYIVHITWRHTRYLRNYYYPFATIALMLFSALAGYVPS